MESSKLRIHDLVEWAKFHYRRNDYKSAIDCFNKVLEINPKDTYAMTIKGTCYYDLQEYKKSINYFDQALEIDPKYTKALFNKGSAHSNLKEY